MKQCPETSFSQFCHISNLTIRQLEHNEEVPINLQESGKSVMLNRQKELFPHANLRTDEQLFPCRSRRPFIHTGHASKAFCFIWEKHCVMSNVKVENRPYSNSQQQLEIIVMMMSFQRKSKHYAAVAKKKKSVRCKNCQDYVCGTCPKPVGLKCLPETE